MFTSYFIYFFIFAGTTESLTITTAEYIYPNTCNNITCSYESAIDERTTLFTVTTANGNRLFSQNIIYIISSNVCTPDGIAHCTDTGSCWCNPNGLSTSICYNHVSDGEGQLTLGCSTGNQYIETLATIAAGTTDGLTIATADFIYPNTCNNITCYYESAIDERTTLFDITAANGNILFQYNIIQIISSNVCTPDGNALCNDIGTCWCDPYGLSTRICYNHTSGGEGQLTLRCATKRNQMETLATIAAYPSNIRPNNVIYSVNEGSIFGPLVCNASCGPPCTFRWVGPGSDINSSVLLINPTEREENGTYQCEAKNTVGTMIANIVLIVKYGPNKVILSPNETSLLLKEGIDVPNIKCKADCQPSCTLSWISPNGQVESKDILTIKNIQMNQTGTYKCNASNEVSNMVSFGVTINLVYSPTILRLELLTGNTVDENQSVNFRCDVNGYPIPDISWIFSSTNNLLLTDKNVSKSNYVIPKANCLHTGSYLCMGSNVIDGEIVNAFSEIELFVLCSARVDQRYHEEPVDIAVIENEDLNITVFLLAYPKPFIIWTMKSHDTGQDYIVNYNNSFNNVEHTSAVYIANVSTKDYGVYTIIANNNIGPAFIKSYTVLPQGPPEQPTDILVTCEFTSMIVSWRPGSNGGFKQTFKVAWLNTITQRTDYSLEIKDSGQKRIQQYIIRSLYPETMYVIHVEATNKNGIVRSTKNANCTTGLGSNNRSENHLTTSIGAGIGVSCFILIVAGLTVFGLKITKRRTYIKKENSKLYQSTQPSTNSSDYDEIGRVKDGPSYQDLKKDNKDSRQQLETPPVYTNMNI